MGDRLGLLLEAGAIQKCDQHGWAKDRSDPHAREEALRIAREDPLAGLSPDEAIAAVREVLDSVGGHLPRMQVMEPQASDGTPGRLID